MLFLFFGHHISPSFVSCGRLYSFFSLFNFAKKKPSNKLGLNPKVEKNLCLFVVNHDF